MWTGSAFGSRARRIATRQRPDSISVGESCAACKVERLPPSVLDDKRSSRARLLLVEIIGGKDSPMNGFDDPCVTFDQRAPDNLHYATQIDDNGLAVLDYLVHVVPCLLPARCYRRV